MRSITVLTNRSESGATPAIAVGLSEAGFQVEIVEFPDRNDSKPRDLSWLEDAHAFVAIVQHPSESLFLHLAYMIGRNKNVWIACDDFERLPLILRISPHIAISDERCLPILIEQIRQRLDGPSKYKDVPSDTRQFISWLRERPNRISELSSRDLERLVLLIITNAGLRSQANIDDTDGDMIVSSPEDGTRLLIQCKSTVPGKKVNIGAIEQAVGLATSAGCDFTLLVSASDYTNAAKEYARSCAPPVWLFDREELERLVTERLVSVKVPTGAGKSSALFEHYLGSCLTSTRIRDRVSKLYGSEAKLWGHLEECEALQKMPHHQPYKNTKCELFLSFNHYSSTPLDESWHQATELIHTLQTNGVKVWHDWPILQAGESCRHLNDVASAVQRCQKVLYFVGKGDDIPFEQALERLKVLQTVTAELNKAPDGPHRIIFVGKDSLWSRLRLPSIYSHSAFVDPSAPNWTSAVIDACNPPSKASKP